MVADRISNEKPIVQTDYSEVTAASSQINSQAQLNSCNCENPGRLVIYIIYLFY